MSMTYLLLEKKSESILAGPDSSYNQHLFADLECLRLPEELLTYRIFVQADQTVFI